LKCPCCNNETDLKSKYCSVCGIEINNSRLIDDMKSLNWNDVIDKYNSTDFELFLKSQFMEENLGKSIYKNEIITYICYVASIIFVIYFNHDGIGNTLIGAFAGLLLGWFVSTIILVIRTMKWNASAKKIKNNSKKLQAKMKKIENMIIEHVYSELRIEKNSDISEKNEELSSHKVFEPFYKKVHDSGNLYTADIQFQYEASKYIVKSIIKNEVYPKMYDSIKEIEKLSSRISEINFSSDTRREISDLRTDFYFKAAVNNGRSNEYSISLMSIKEGRECLEVSSRIKNILEIMNNESNEIERELNAINTEIKNVVDEFKRITQNMIPLMYYSSDISAKYNEVKELIETTENDECHSIKKQNDRKELLANKINEFDALLRSESADAENKFESVKKTHAELKNLLRNSNETRIRGKKIIYSDDVLNMENKAEKMIESYLISGGDSDEDEIRKQITKYQTQRNKEETEIKNTISKYEEDIRISREVSEIYFRPNKCKFAIEYQKIVKESV